jgi:hypothetical protein
MLTAGGYDASVFCATPPVLVVPDAVTAELLAPELALELATGADGCGVAGI